MFAKRKANSPAGKRSPKKLNMPPKKVNPATDGTKVTVEVFGLNDKDYFGSL